MQFSQLYEDTVSTLRQAGIDDAQVDAVLLLEYCFGLNRSQLFLDGTKEVPVRELKLYYSILERRLSREPLHYIVGFREFWSLDFIVSPAVLVPRPETEFVLETVLSTLRKYGYNQGPVLDMCTGSGVIAIVLSRELNAGYVTAADISPEALQIAAQNIHKFGLKGSVSLVCSDLFTALRQNEKYEVIIANPPYIAEDDIAGLQAEVRDWEPFLALTGGPEGLDVIGEIADQAYRHLASGGWLFVEIGADQGEKAPELFTAHASKKYDCVNVLPDWSGRPRLLQARKVRECNG